jgi:hypothetical protein
LRLTTTLCLADAAENSPADAPVVAVKARAAPADAVNEMTARAKATSATPGPMRTIPGFAPPAQRPTATVTVDLGAW